jgi:tripartite ATP-independent transporter DctP family solute receptor
MIGSMKRRGEPLTRRSVLRYGVAAAAAVALPAVLRGARAAGVQMRLGSDSPLGDEHSIALVKLKELVESRTGGRVTVLIFPNGQLGDNVAMMNSIKAGTLDGNYTDVGSLSGAVPEVDVVSLPFLFADKHHAVQALNGSLGDKLKPKIEKAFNCALLGWGSDGVRNMWNSKHPILTPDDVKGLKMRVQASQIHKDTYAALGALPTPVAFSELYTALQTGVVDGADVGTVDMLSLKFYQVTKYLTLTQHVPIMDAMVISDKFLAKVSPQDREIIREAGKAASEFQVKATFDREASAIKELQDKGIQVIELSDKKPFADRMTVVYDAAAKQIGDASLIELARSGA